MNDPFRALSFLAVFLLVGCATGGRSSHPSCAVLPTRSDADRSSRIEGHFDRVESQVARTNRLLRRTSHDMSQPLLLLHDLRTSFAAYREADRQLRMYFAANGLVLSGEEERLQHQFLDAYSAQLRHLEESLTRMRKARKA